MLMVIWWSLHTVPLSLPFSAKTIKNSAKVNKEMSVQELKALLDKATQEIARLKTYVTCLEEELRLVKGDVTITVKSPAPGAKGTPVAAVKQQATASVLSPDTRSKLPNVAAIQRKHSILSHSTYSSTITHLRVVHDFLNQ